MKKVSLACTALALLLLGTPANAVVYNISLTGDPTSGSGGSNSYRFSLAGDPITISDGDTITADVSFSSPFTVPASSGQFIFLEFFRRDGIDALDPKSSTSSNVINGATYTGGCSNCLANLFDNGGQALTFSGGTFSTTFALSAPYEITDFQFGYQIDAIPPAAVPEPATWAMLTGGFGAVGGAIRRRRGLVARTA